MGYIVLLFVVLLLTLTGLLWPALIFSGWVLLAVLAAVMVGIVFRSIISEILTGMFSLSGLLAPEIPEPPHGKDAPKPGDPDWLDWANRRGRYTGT